MDEVPRAEQRRQVKELLKEHDELQKVGVFGFAFFFFSPYFLQGSGVDCGCRQMVESMEGAGGKWRERGAEIFGGGLFSFLFFF
jgi:hypothetical protein